jgi:hypothetical protein
LERFSQNILLAYNKKYYSGALCFNVLIDYPNLESITRFNSTSCVTKSQSILRPLVKMKLL